METKLPLKELSIDKLYNGEKATYEVPIYQRNYAWEKNEISTLIQDVYDAFVENKKRNHKTYYIGTLVSFHKGDNVYEVIDGQQRLTTIYLILKALQIKPKNKLTYRAREKSNKTIDKIDKLEKTDDIEKILSFEIEENDSGIVSGFNYAKKAIDEIVPKDKDEKKEFINFFQCHVYLIHYQVPKDIDLNHYFEIMNSRGEQLEKHEIIKARLIDKLNDEDWAVFNRLWEFCSEMNVYIQQKYSDTKIFGKNFCDFVIDDFDKLNKDNNKEEKKKISELINVISSDNPQEETNKIDSFQPVIDFPNFLLIVLKLTRMEDMEDKAFNPTDFYLDDKYLIKEFEDVPQIDAKFVKQFAFNLLKAKFLLDNFIVHHSNEDETNQNNPWKLQRWQEDDEKNRYLKNLDGEKDAQFKLVHLLSMFEVSYSTKQRKNYLFYCILYLFKNDYRNVEGYLNFVSDLAKKYFYDVYLDDKKLNVDNTPIPYSFDNSILKNNELDVVVHNNNFNFIKIYGDGTEVSKGVPLFVFNYLDYKLWMKYYFELRGKGLKKDCKERDDFFKALGCSDFGLDFFDEFYFSRTRNSLEHYYPQASATGKNGELTEEEINCFGNYAMIGSGANSSGSNWSPKEKFNRYLDKSGKINRVSVASIKLWIMMQKCKDNDIQNQNSSETRQEWNFDDIKEHQKKMLEILQVY